MYGNSIAVQKYKVVQDAIEEFHSSFRIPRRGYRNGYNFPGVIGVLIKRTVISRNRERASGVDSLTVQLSQYLQESLGFPVLIVAGENRYHSNSESKDGLIVCTRDTHLPSVARSIRDFAEESEIISGDDIEFTGVDDQSAKGVIRHMFDCSAPTKRKANSSIFWA